MIEASKLLSKHEVDKALDIYKTINAVNEYESHDLALAKTIKSWSEDSSENKLMLAHSNNDVNELNRMARNVLIKMVNFLLLVIMLKLLSVILKLLSEKNCI